jgi:CHAT domain-containing protein
VQKQQYQNDYNELKDLKTEIERIQNLLERSRVNMQKDFE